MLATVLLLPASLSAQSSPVALTTRSNTAPPKIPIPSHVVSVSKQITVFAEDQGLAAALAAFADKIKARLLNKLLLRDQWRYPVVIAAHAQSRSAAAGEAVIRSSVYQVERSLKYQIDCVVPPPLNQEEFVRQMVQVLCSEIVNRAQASTQLAITPLWFSEGLTQNLLGDVRSIELDLVARARPAEQGSDLRRLQSIEQLPPPGIERELFTAKCKLLVRALAALHDGPRRAQRFLTGLQPEVPWREAFRAAYGDVLTDLDTAEAWWTEQLKWRAGPSPVNRLSAEETDGRLMKILKVEAIYRDPSSNREVVKQVPLAGLKSYMDKPGTIAMVQDRIQQIESLQRIAHQSYLPVLESYIEAFNHVLLNRFRLLNSTLRQAESLLQQTRQRNAEISASLDQLESQQVSRELLFLYRDYFQTFEEIKAIEKSRDSAIKAYLDRFQQEGAN